MKYLLCGAALLALVFHSSAAKRQERFRVVEAFPNLSFEEPVDLQVAPGVRNRWFVVERRGVIRSFVANRDTTESDTFIDISDRVVSSSGELGLLGLAFDPEFAQNGYFYLNYTASAPLRTVVSRFQVAAGSALRGDLSSEFKLLEFNQPFSNHNGGQIRFGPDGYLYIASGDGGSAGDPQGNGQSLTTMLGKILRIDVRSVSTGRNYSIPSGNPFAADDEALPEIFAYGLRNPWRFSFDRSTGQIWAADVGQDAREEIDRIVVGGNYGWNIREGRACSNPAEGCRRDGLIAPEHEYKHTVGTSVTGGFVYRGTRLNSLRGRYIYADFVSGKVWALRPRTDDIAKQNRLLVDTELLISSFGEDHRGELAILSYGDGKIYRIRRGEF